MYVTSMRQADFGPRLYDELMYPAGLEASMVLAQPQGACSPLTNAHEVDGKLALVTISEELLAAGNPCTVVTMAMHVMEAGGRGVLFFYDEYKLVSDDTIAAANISIPVRCSRRSSFLPVAFTPVSVCELAFLEIATMPLASPDSSFELFNRLTTECVSSRRLS